MNTYTYTARNVDNPDKVLTFTLQGDFLKINLTGVEDDLVEIIAGDKTKKNLKEAISDQTGPTALKVMEEISGPVHLSDVLVSLNGEDQKQLKITLWKRLAGLRAAPVILDMGEIDNPSAAQKFSQELRARQETAGKISKFFGPLDYWLGWIGMVFLTLFFIRRPSKE
jgi:hypothetical protein